MHFRIMTSVSLVLLTVFMTTTDVWAWGVERAHQQLANQALQRANLDGRLDAFFREAYGLDDGLHTRLAVFLGIDRYTQIDGEFASGRFSRILGGLIDGDPAPVDSYLIQSARSEPDPLRFSVSHLIRAGVFAEDNPNPRSRHHFHDPVTLHEPPAGNRGLDDRGRIATRFDEYLAEIGAVVLPGHGGDLALLKDGLRRLFDPFSNTAVSGQGNFNLTGRSALDRALDRERDGSSPSQQTPRNLFALPDVERLLYDGLVATTEAEREAALAYHFLAFGHVLHLLQDMTSPGHTRNDFANEHVMGAKILGVAWFGPSLETVGDSRAAVDLIEARGIERPPFVSLPRRFLEELNQATGSERYPVHGYSGSLAGFDPTGLDLAAFWDTETLSQGMSEEPSRTGLAERVAPEFLTRGSISNTGLTGYPNPAIPSGCNVRLPLRDLDGRAEFYPLTSIAIEAPYISSALVPHLARCRYHWKVLEEIVEDPEWPFEYGFTVIDSSVQRDYMEHLFALAVDYAEHFVRQYFSPRVSVVPVGPGAFRLRNPTMLPLRGDRRAIEIVYTTDELDGHRARVAADCGGGEFLLSPASTPDSAGPPGDFVCAIPQALPFPPLDRADFWVLFRGAHGQRGAVGTPEEFDARQKDYVVAFDRVQPRILYHRAVEQPDAPDEDRRNPLDVYSLPAGLGNPLGEGEIHVPGTNLTARLRAEIGSDVLDLAVPTGEPGGARILLRSDRDATRQSTVNPSVGAPERLYLFDPAVDPAAPDALVALPLSELEEGRNRLRDAGVWSNEGAAIFYFEDETSSQGNRLRRYSLATGEAELFGAEEAFASSRDPSESANDLPIGTERRVCREIDHLAARSASELAVTTHCRREIVALVPNGGGQRHWAPQADGAHTEIRVATVEPSASEPGTLAARFTARFDVGSALVLQCGLSQTCWQPSSEPGGESDSDHANPAWSPDGSQVAFLRDPEGAAGGDFRQEIWVADLATGQLRLALGREHGDLYDLQWSPDGRWLVFGIAIAGEAGDVFAIPADADGTELPQRLTRGLAPPSLSIHAPLLLPDGS